ncbi:MAG: GIY-YIG nuclease family protein [Candidatus Peribacteraceae bacterium]
MKRNHQYWVYMLLCADGTYYTGVTNNLDRRLAEHDNCRNPESYTSTRRPLRLVYSSEFQYILNAIRTEKKLKSWSQAKKSALAEGRFEDLPKLSKKCFKK